jgi:hypothetical protein
MELHTNRTAAVISAIAFCLWACLGAGFARAQAPYSSSSQSQGQSSSSSSSSAGGAEFSEERAPSALDPAGPTISLISSEPVFYLASALNACGYDEGLNESDPIRKWVREQMNAALAKSEAARAARDKMCLYVTQHRMTGTDEDIAQYISLALYLTQPPNLDITAAQNEMPPDATQVVGIVPLVKAFAQSIDLHGIWLVAHRQYDHEVDLLHNPISKMIVETDGYLVLEPMLSPHLVNARIYGVDYIVVVSPVNGKIPMGNVRHTYLHYVIDPLLFSRRNGLKMIQPVIKAIQYAPLRFQVRSNPTLLTVDCLIKAIEARTMDTGIPVYKIPAGVNRSQLPRYQHLLEQYRRKVEVARQAEVRHDMRQGYVLTEYFYDQLLDFEKSPESLSKAIGPMVFGMDVNQQVSRAKQTDFDKVADQDILQRPVPVKLTGLDLAEAKLSEGDIKTAASLAQKAIADETNTPASMAAAARANFILARVALMTGHPNEAFEDFHKTIATGKDPRIVAWSHIYLGRMLDLSCRRDEALAQYKAAMTSRDGRLDTRLAAERGEKGPYEVNGHTCQADADADEGAPPPATKPAASTTTGSSAPAGTAKPQQQQ